MIKDITVIQISVLSRGNRGKRTLAIRWKRVGGDPKVICDSSVISQNVWFFMERL